MRALFSILVGLAVALPARATTILVLFTPKAVYFGSDSQISLVDGSQARNGCKIHITNNFIWASAGLLYETRGPFDLRNIMGSVLAIDRPFSQATVEVEHQVGDQYKGFLNRAAETGIDQATARTDVVIANAAGTVQVANITFQRGAVTKVICPSQSCSTLGLFELGEHGMVDKILDRRHSIWKERGIPSAMKYLIGAQERNTPRFVSGPIAIVEVDQSGAHWISAAACSPRR